MNKKLLVIAVAGIMAMPLAANAGGKHKVYGKVHLSVDRPDTGEVTVDGQARKASNIGMKGSMDTNLADFKAIYRIEAGMVIGSGGGFAKERDTWAGLASKSMGTLRIGTMATHWKQMGKATDAVFTTSIEGRSLIKTQSSKLVGGTGGSRGRATKMVRYDSPSISGAKIIAQYQFVDGGENNTGIGLQYKAGNYLAFFDYMDLKAIDKTAMKLGGKAKFGPASLSFQYAIDDNGSVETTAGGENQLHVQGAYSMGATKFVLTVGNNSENTGYGVAVMQKVAKKATAYVAYGADGSGDDDSTVVTVGMKVAFGK